MQASICLANPDFLPSEKKFSFFPPMFYQQQSHPASQQLLPSTYFSSLPSLINRLSVEHMTFTPLLILAGCRDAETSWLGGGKMPFMWLCKANILGVCKASVMLNLLEFQRVFFFFFPWRNWCFSERHQCMAETYFKSAYEWRKRISPLWWGGKSAKPL